MNDENKGFRKRAKAFLEDKGVYLVLLLCIAVIGAAAALACLPGKAEEPGPGEEASQVSRSGDESLSALRGPGPSPSPTPGPVPDIAPNPSAAPRAAVPSRKKAAPPLDGRIQWRFAVDELIYSRTLNQWMTHRGVDLTAAKGQEVRCVWGGTVEDVYEDDSLGVTVRMEHSGGKGTCYSNLRMDCPVKKGDRLNAGDIVGYVGDTSVAECGDGPHLHFEVHIDGRPVDPEDYVIFPKTRGE